MISMKIKTILLKILNMKCKFDDNTQYIFTSELSEIII